MGRDPHLLTATIRTHCRFDSCAEYEPAATELGTHDGLCQSRQRETTGTPLLVDKYVHSPVQTQYDSSRM
jgi:hypothetical protein